MLTLALVALSTLAAAALAASSVVGRRELRSLVPVRAQPLTRALTVIVPARDEGERLLPTLDALLSDDSDGLRVVVYDDRSADNTRDIVRERARSDARLQLIEGAHEPAPGAFGKPSALAAATAAAADADLLTDLVLFLDADVTLKSGALGGLVAAHDGEQADATSGLPTLVTVTLAEQMLVPVFTSLFGPLYRPSAVHDDARAAAFLNGQLILVSAQALSSVGGWAAVTDTVLEDVALARLLKSAGKRLRLVDVRALASTRMYDSLGAIVEGFGKNAVALYRGRARLGAFALFSVAFSFLPFVAVASAAGSQDPRLLVVAGGALAVVLGAQLRLRSALAVPVWPILIGPLVYLVVSALLLRAALSRSVTWKRRSYES